MISSLILGLWDTRSLLKYISTPPANYFNDENSKWMPNVKICQRLRDKSVSYWCYLLNNEHQTSHAVGMMSGATCHNYKEIGVVQMLNLHESKMVTILPSFHTG